MTANALLDRAKSAVERKALITLMAYAAGDAFGVGYEFLEEPAPVDMSSIAAREGWPSGGVSDDTLLSLITIQSVRRGAPDESASIFLATLHDRLPELRGLGPTTRAALGMDVPHDQVALIGNTNGGMMRTSLLGLGYTPERADERRAMVAGLTKATHHEPAAIASAVLCSALYADVNSIDRSNAEILRVEASAMTRVPAEVESFLTRIDDWTVNESGVTLDPLETLAAVVFVLDRARSLSDAYRLACELGGDTDTVAALAGGIFASRNLDDTELLSIPWIDDVAWSEVSALADAAALLSSLKAER